MTAATGFGSGLGKKFVDLAVDILERRGFAVYGTRTAIERLNDLGETPYKPNGRGRRPTLGPFK